MDNVIKHSAVIQIAGSLTLAQRQSFNAMLKHAHPWMDRGADHYVLLDHLGELLRKSPRRHREWLIETAQSLSDTPVRFNVLGKDRQDAERWRVHTRLLAEVAYHPSTDMLAYSFPNSIVDLLAHPRMYSKINLDIQATFRGHYGLPLYEYYLDVLGGKRDHTELTLWISDVRRLLALHDAYPEVRRLNDKVIKPAHREINANTDLSITVDQVLRENRKIVGLHLHIERRTTGATTTYPSELGEGPLIRVLQGFFDRRHIPGVLAKYEPDYIQAQIDYTRAGYNQGTVERPGAYLQKALQVDFAGHREQQRRHQALERDRERARQRSEAQLADQREARDAKALEARFEDHRLTAVRRRYEVLSEEQQKAYREAFEASSAYDEARALLRGRGPDSGLYQQKFRAYLLDELCPETHYHDLEAFKRWWEDYESEES